MGKLSLEFWKCNYKSIIGFDPENEEECIKAVKKLPHLLQHIKNQTPEICLSAVSDYDLYYDLYIEGGNNSLQYVKEQTPEICLEAIKQDPQSIIYVRDLSMLENVELEI